MGGLYLILTLVSTAAAKECYDCGYQINDWTPDNKGEQIPLEGIPLCGDDTALDSHRTDCESEEECCGMIREYFVKEPGDGLPRYIDMVARHACEKTLIDMFDSGPNVTCNMGWYKCYNISFDNLPEHEATYAEACYCEGDRCNNKIPDLPDPQPSTQKPSSLPPGTFHKCYDCGYRCNNMKDTHCIPEPIDNDGKVPFCGDIAVMETTTKQCGGGDECCGSVKEYFIQTNEDNTTRTDMVAYHGCQTDLDSFLNIKIPLICAAGDNSSCVDISRDDISDQKFTRAEACFCDKDLCNNDTPDFPDPVSTTKLPSKTCYDCGYACINMTGDSCTPVPIDDHDTLRFCKDKATMSSYTKQCEGGDDCCGSLREYFEIIDPKTKEKTVNMIAYHGCEKDLAPALNANFSVICDSHTNSCYNASSGDPNSFMMFAKACFCDGDRCNSDLPSLPDPVPGGATSHQLLTVSLFCLILIVILF